MQIPAKANAEILYRNQVIDNSAKINKNSMLICTAKAI